MRFLTLIVSAAIIALFVACSPDPDPGADCEEGTEGCPCYPNDTCNEGFVCYGGECMGLDDIDGPPSGPASNPPAEVPPSDPGYVHISPEMTVLEPGDSSFVDATSYDVELDVDEDATYDWDVPEELAVATPSGPTVELTGLQPGTFSVSVTDHRDNRAYAVVHVIDDASSADDGSEAFEGPIGVEFDEPVARAEVGGQIVVEPRIYDVDGTWEGSDEDVEIVSTDEPILRSAGDGTFEAESPGGAHLQAIYIGDGSVLAGQKLVTVDDPDAVPSIALECDNPETIVHSCDVRQIPSVFPEPDMTGDKIIVNATYTEACDDEEIFGATRTRVRNRAPDAVEVQGLDVVDINADGVLSSLAAGTAVVEVKVDGVLCDPVLGVTVYPDLEGSWAASCQLEGQSFEGMATVSDSAFVAHRRGLHHHWSYPSYCSLRSGNLSSCMVADDFGECEDSRQVMARMCGQITYCGEDPRPEQFHDRPYAHYYGNIWGCTHDANHGRLPGRCTADNPCTLNGGGGAGGETRGIWGGDRTCAASLAGVTQTTGGPLYEVSSTEPNTLPSSACTLTRSESITPGEACEVEPSDDNGGDPDITVVCEHFCETQFYGCTDPDTDAEQLCNDDLCEDGYEHLEDEAGTSCADSWRTFIDCWANAGECAGDDELEASCTPEFNAHLELCEGHVFW